MGKSWESMQVIQGDITKLPLDAIVNAANPTLLGGGGVDGAIHRAAGPALLEACRKLNGCLTGQAKITPGFLLPSRYVIHTVGPIYKDGQSGETELLRSCYEVCLELAVRYQCGSIAFPCISTGVYGYPREPACAIAVYTVKAWLQAARNDLNVHFCCFSREDYSLYRLQLG